MIFLRSIIFGALVLIAQSVQAQPTGELELGLGISDFAHTDMFIVGEEMVEDTLTSLGVAASLAANINNWNLGFDINHMQRNLGAGDNFEDQAPEGATAIGFHFGQEFGDTYYGGFIGKNRFQGFDSGSANGYVWGTLFGVEATHKMSFGKIFGQIGRAKMTGEAGDTAFDGEFLRFGVDVDLARGDILASYERGKSGGIFEDLGDSGSYERIEILYEYPINERLIGVIGTDVIHIKANIEDASAVSNWTFGLRLPIGENRRRNPLRTTYMPGLAAAWAETLDGTS